MTAVHEVQTLIYSCFYSNSRFKNRLTEWLTAPYICALYRTKHNRFYTLCNALYGQFMILSLVTSSLEGELIWILQFIQAISVTVNKDSSLLVSKMKHKMLLVLLKN